MKRDDLIRLRHMLDAGNDAMAFAANRKRQELDTDRMLALSLLKCIEIVGEAESHVTRELRAQHPQIPWEDIIGMRHRLIHAYYDVNLGILWKTVTEDLPPLLEMLKGIIAEEGA
jgi:uncharacterized protein with HEPN domain